MQTVIFYFDIELGGIEIETEKSNFWRYGCCYGSNFRRECICSYGW